MLTIECRMRIVNDLIANCVEISELEKMEPIVKAVVKRELGFSSGPSDLWRAYNSKHWELRNRNRDSSSGDM